MQNLCNFLQYYANLCIIKMKAYMDRDTASIIQARCRHIRRKLYITGKHHSIIGTQSAGIGWMVAVNIICMFAFEVLRSAIRISACYSKKVPRLVALRHLRITAIENASKQIISVTRHNGHQSTDFC